MKSEKCVAWRVTTFVLCLTTLLTACNDNFQRDGKATMSKCLNEQTRMEIEDWSDAQFWLGESDYLTIKSVNTGEYDLMHHTHLTCCMDYHTSYVLNGNEITIRDWATGLFPCDCTCSVESNGHFENVVDGTYTIQLKSVDATITATFHAGLDTLIVIN